MLQGIDYLVIAVHDLQTAIANYEVFSLSELWFSVLAADPPKAVGRRLP